MGKAVEARGDAGRDESDPWQPLNGLMIVEVGEGVAVAFCGKMLADYGATVIKVEQPGSSDPVRAAGPDGLGGDGLIHLHINSNKRSVSLDLANEAEREELIALCRSADGVIGFFDRVLLDLGVNPEALRAAADPLIVLALSWFGLTGPWRNFKCNDFLAQHASGLSFVTATRVDDLERQPPLAAQGRLAEMVAGLTGATAVLIALARQETESRGDTIDCAVVESLTAFLRGDTAPFTYGAGLLSRGKGAIGTIAPVALRETADGAVDFVIVRQSHWQALMELIGNPEWADLELFATPDLRRFHWDAIEPLLSESIAGFTSEYLFHEGQRRNVVCAPMNTVGQVLESDLINEREFVRTGDHPRHGPLRYPGLPFRVGEPRTVTPAPDPGEHTAEVLAGRLEPESARPLE